MSGATGWKIATLALTVTSLGLAAALVTQPTPVTSRSPTTQPVILPQRDAAPAQERRHIAPPPVVDPERDAQAVDDARKAEQAAALDAMTIEEVCRRQLLVVDGRDRSDTPAMEQIVARLQRDSERAEAILEDWLRRRHEIRAAGLTGTVGAPVSLAYVGLRGADAAPLLREIVLEQEDLEHLGALIRTGDAAALKELDAWQRSLVEGMIGVHRVISGGPRGIDLVRDWAFDEDVREALRSQSRRCLWSYGTDADRERLLRVASREEVVSRFFYVASFDKKAREDWKTRLQELVAAALGDEDPWVRLLAVHRTLTHAPWTGSPWPDVLIARAADEGRELIDLPPPGGRDVKQWTGVCGEVTSMIAALERRPEHERRIREVLGFQQAERTDTK